MNGRSIQQMRFMTYRCPWMMAAGSVLTGLAENQSIEAVGGITAEELTLKLGEVPANKRECVSMSLGAMQDALSKLRR